LACGVIGVFRRFSRAVDDVALLRYSAPAVVLPGRRPARVGDTGQAAFLVRARVIGVGDEGVVGAGFLDEAV